MTRHSAKSDLLCAGTPMGSRVLGVLLFVAVAAACSGTDGDATDRLRTTATPAGGEDNCIPVSEEPTIRLEANRPANIYFTLNGQVPDPETADPVNGPTFVARSPVVNIPVAYDGMPLMYFAIDDEGNTEEIRLERYCLDGPPICTASPEPGLYNHHVTVEISAKGGETATVYYTTDSSPPNPDNHPANPAIQKGAAPLDDIVLRQTTQLKWRCVDELGNEEDVRSGTYTIDTVPPISEASPAGGFFYTAADEVPIDVEIRIVNNDTGIIFWTDNGAVPQADDPQGHTHVSPINASPTLDASTVLRYRARDKAHNWEEHAGEPYNQDVYIVDDQPVAAATPPGGGYTADEIDVVLAAFPGEATMTYSVNGSSFQAYGGGDIHLDTREAELRIRTYYQGARVDSTEFYELGVASESVVYDEEFLDTSNIDMGLDEHPDKPGVPRAVVDTDAGAVRLPRVPVEEHSRRVVDVDFQQILGFDWAHDAAYEVLVMPDHVAVLDGQQGPGSGELGPGLKIYSLSAASNPQLSYASRVPSPSSNDTPLVALELINSEFGADNWAVVGSQGSYAFDGTPIPGELHLVDVSSPGSPVVRAATEATVFRQGFNTSPANRPLLATRNGSGVFYGALRDNGSELASFQVTGADAEVDLSRLDKVAVPGGAQVVAMDFIPETGQAGLVLLDAACGLHVVDEASTPGNLGFSGSTISVCNPSDHAPTALLGLETQSGLDSADDVFAVAVYDTGDGPQASIVNLEATGDRRQDILPAGSRPGSSVWGVGSLFSEGATEPGIALSGGDAGVFIYDATNLASVASGDTATLTYLQTVIAAGFDVDGLAAVPDSVTTGDELFLLGKLWDDGGSEADSSGVVAWRVPRTFRDYVDKAFLQSTNVNPDTSKAVEAVKYDDNDFGGQVDFFISRDGVNFKRFNCCTFHEFSSPSNQVYWRAELERGDPLPELRKLVLRLDYP